MKKRFASLNVSNRMKQIVSFILYWPQFAATLSIEISIANLQQKHYNEIRRVMLFENLIVIQSYTIETTSFAIPLRCAKAMFLKLHLLIYRKTRSRFWNVNFVENH